MCFFTPIIEELNPLVFPTGNFFKREDGSFSVFFFLSLTDEPGEDIIFAKEFCA